MVSDDIKACQLCGLYKQMPDGCRPVPGKGPLNAKIMIVGEALGGDEALLEEPFIGQSGQLLNKLLKEAGLKREEIYITNRVKCRPTDDGKKNRKPSKNEMTACEPWLRAELWLVKPKIIVPLGIIASSYFLKSSKSQLRMENLVGIKFEYLNKSIIIPNYHPSFLMQYGKSYYERALDTFKEIKRVSDEL